MLPSMIKSGAARVAAGSGLMPKSLCGCWRARSSCGSSNRMMRQKQSLAICDASSRSQVNSMLSRRYNTVASGSTSEASQAQLSSTPQSQSIESLQAQLSALQADIQKLTYTMHQSTSSLNQTQQLARRAEARAYIIEEKLIDIQSHVVQIPRSLQSLEGIANNIGERLQNVLPQRMKDKLHHSRKLLSNKYALWTLLLSSLLFYQYRSRMYQRTSEQVANVAAMTLQQETLRNTIQETLNAVAKSPDTLESLSLLFQRLIWEERTEQHLIDLIVRALNSESVKLAALALLQSCFESEELQRRGGLFLKVATNHVLLDEDVQKNVGVGIQQALKSVVALNVPWVAGWKNKGQQQESNDGDGIGTSIDDTAQSEDDLIENSRVATDSGVDEDISR